MKILIVKTSSMGDVIHMLTALSDAGQLLNDVTFDWVVEEGFAEIPAWHPLVKRVIPFALRRWRKKIIRSLCSREFWRFWRELRKTKYDVVVDAQGLIKSAAVTYFARGKKIGLDKKSLTEKLARFAYQKKLSVDITQHAVWRMRHLLALALNYEVPNTEPNYGLSRTQFKNLSQAYQPYILFLHGTTWKTKCWPKYYWMRLAKLVTSSNYKVVLPWYTLEEEERANAVASQVVAAKVLPSLSLSQMAGVIAHAVAVVTVDTGLGHLSAALNMPTVALYGPTDPNWIGIKGQTTVWLDSAFECVHCDSRDCHYQKTAAVFPACFSSVTPELVWEALKNMISKKR